MISRLSTSLNKKIFARATSQESAMSRAKIAPATERSGVVRGRSASSLPARGNIPGPSAWGASVVLSLHPGPLDGREDGSPISGAFRVGGSGYSGNQPVTVLKPRNPYKSTAYCAGYTVTGGASRYVRARAYVRLCAHVRGLISVTLKPSIQVHEKIGFSGYRAVTARLHLKPAMRSEAQTRRNPPFLNKIGGGYWGSVDRDACSWPIWGLREGRAAKSFGARRADRLGGGRAAGAAGGSIEQLDQVRGALGRNGGFPWVSGGLIGHVETGLFKWTGKAEENQRASASCRKLSRLTARRGVGGWARSSGWRQAGGVSIAEAPPAPPKPRAPGSGPLAHAIFSLRFEPSNGCPWGLPEARQSGPGQTGSGEALPAITWGGQAGRGTRDFRRFQEDHDLSVQVAHVN